MAGYPLEPRGTLEVAASVALTSCRILTMTMILEPRCILRRREGGIRGRSDSEVGSAAGLTGDNVTENGARDCTQSEVLRVRNCTPTGGTAGASSESAMRQI